MGSLCACETYGPLLCRVIHTTATTPPQSAFRQSRPSATPPLCRTPTNSFVRPFIRSSVHSFVRSSQYQHIMVDLGTGDNNKINWAMTEKQDFIDIVETVYRGARKGRGLVTSPVDYSTKYRY